MQTDSDTVIVTIDGPAGAGKSTVARLLAEALGFDYLDTGAMYRSVTHAALSHRINLDEKEAIFNLAKTLQIEIDGNCVRLNGLDVSDAIRTPEVGTAIGSIADNIQVRHLLSRWQRAWAKGRRVITEGRDQGSEVFPDAACKIFLVASSQERARRRQSELAAKGIQLDWETVLNQQNQRDLEDRSRPVGALRKAEDSIEFSTDGLSLEAVVSRLETIVRERLARMEQGIHGVDDKGNRPGD